MIPSHSPPPAWTHLVAIVGPWAEGKVALLPVEGEVGDVHHTCALCDGWRVPHYLSIVAQLHISAGRTCRLLICSAQSIQSKEHICRCIMTHTHCCIMGTLWSPVFVFLYASVFSLILLCSISVSCYWLVVEDDVRLPNQVAGDVDHLKVVVVLLVPLQVCIVPDLPDPQIRGQHLVPFILHARTHI